MLPTEVLEALENHPKANEKFVGTFTTYQEVVNYFPDWWEDRYSDMSNEEIIHEWSERNYTRVAEFEGRYLVFGNCDL